MPFVNRVRPLPTCCCRYKRHVLTISEFFQNSARLPVGRPWIRDGSAHSSIQQLHGCRAPTFIESRVQVRRIEIHGGARPASGARNSLLCSWLKERTSRRASTAQSAAMYNTERRYLGVRCCLQWLRSETLHDMRVRYSNAPLRMQRVCILGPCGSGRKRTSME